MFYQLSVNPIQLSYLCQIILIIMEMMLEYQMITSKVVAFCFTIDISRVFEDSLENNSEITPGVKDKRFIEQ